MLKRSARVISWALVLVVASSCRTGRFPIPEWGTGVNVQRIENGEVRWDDESLGHMYREERARTNNADPALCVALSGGGIRSASYSIGVLAGLSDTGVLDRVDLLSGISGGSYALSWYMAMHYYHWRYPAIFDVPFSDEALFKPGGVYQQWLEGNLVVAPPTTKFNLDAWWRYLGSGIATLALVPVNVVANGVPFAGGWNTTLLRDAYEDHIEQAFHTVPKWVNGRVEQANRRRLAPFFRGVRHGIPLEDFRALLESRAGLPSFLITTAWFTEDKYYNHDDLMRSRLYELTPFRVGNPVVGWHPPEEVHDYRLLRGGLTLSRAVAISGAAVDSAGLSLRWRRFKSGLNFDLGYHVNNPQGPSNLPTAIVPLSYVVMKRTKQTPKGSRILLTDGGHVENLSTFPLVARRCRTIIVVDAEQDGDFEFEGLAKLIESLDYEMGASWHWADVDWNRFGKTREGQKVPGWAGSRAVDHPVAKAEIRLSKAGEEAIDVTYIKLGLNVKNLDRYPNSVSHFYRTRCVGREDCIFPHDSTMNQTFDAETYRAYRDLGRHHVCVAFEANASDPAKSCHDRIDSLANDQEASVGEVATRVEMREVDDR